MQTRSRELLAVGIFGCSSLGDRIEALLKRGREFSPRVSSRGAASSGLMLLGFTIAGTLAPHWIAFAQQAPRPSFEVASVKPGDPNDTRFRVGTPPGGGFVANNASLTTLIQFAYDVRNHQLSGGPNWLNSEKFTIEAKPDSASPIPGGPVDNPRVRQMLQSLLAERFKLIVHREIKEQPVYDLVIAKGGPKLKESGGEPSLRMGRGHIWGVAVPMSIWVNQLSQQLGRTVIDKTGLTSAYDLDLKWTPDPAQAAAFGPSGPDAAPSDPNGPSLFTAIQEQLGLRLEATKRPVDSLVIDHAEKPDAN